MPRKTTNRENGNGRGGLSEDNPWHIKNVLRNFDSYGENVPSFNIKGAKSVNTLCGGIVSATIATLALLYATTKFIGLMEHSNPVLSEHTIAGYYGSTD